MMPDLPERIWAALFDGNGRGICWSKDHGLPDETPYVRADALVTAIAERDEARAEAERLKTLLRDVLALEAEKASNKGDCCCMFWDRTREREYETGTCPHQRARRALDGGE